LSLRGTKPGKTVTGTVQENDKENLLGRLWKKAYRESRIQKGEKKTNLGQEESSEPLLRKNGDKEGGSGENGRKPNVEGYAKSHAEGKIPVSGFLKKGIGKSSKAVEKEKKWSVDPTHLRRWGLAGHLIKKSRF